MNPLWLAIRCLIQPPTTATVLIKVLDVLWIHSTAATVFNLCCVSVDRFIAIRCPFRYQDIITKQRCYIVITLVWLISLSLPFLRVIFRTIRDVENLWSFLTVTMVFIPIALVTLCYVWIYKAARKQATAMRRVTHAAGNYKAIKTVGFVLGVFLASWMPSFVVSVLHYLPATDSCVEHKLYTVVWPWIEAIAFTSSAINPWVYCFRNSEFRQALRRSFRCFFSVEVTPQNNSVPYGN